MPFNGYSIKSAVGGTPELNTLAKMIMDIKEHEEFLKEMDA
jgi:hypothetical protein